MEEGVVSVKVSGSRMFAEGGKERQGFVVGFG